MSKQRHILVTGAPCSGTTWVGKSLATAEGFTYVHEPLNPINQPTWLNNLPQYILPEDLEELNLKDLLFNRINVTGNYLLWRASSGHIRDKLYYIKQAILARLKQNRMVKEPHACLIAGELSTLFDFKIVWVVRHPGAFVESMFRKNWKIEMERWKASKSILSRISKKSQELLLRDNLDPIQSLALSWRIIQEVGGSISDNKIIIKYEDLLLGQEPIWRQIFDQLKLKNTKSLEKSLDRNNKLNLIRKNGWSNKLQADQHEKIFSIVQGMPPEVNPYF